MYRPHPLLVTQPQYQNTDFMVTTNKYMYVVIWWVGKPGHMHADKLDLHGFSFMGQLKSCSH